MFSFSVFVSYLHAVDAAATLHASCGWNRMRLQKKSSPLSRASSASNIASWDSRRHRFITAVTSLESMAAKYNDDDVQCEAS